MEKDSIYHDSFKIKQPNNSEKQQKKRKKIILLCLLVILFVFILLFYWRIYNEAINPGNTTTPSPTKAYLNRPTDYPTRVPAESLMAKLGSECPLVKQKFGQKKYDKRYTDAGWYYFNGSWANLYDYNYYDNVLEEDMRDAINRSKKIKDSLLIVNQNFSDENLLSNTPQNQTFNNLKSVAVAELDRRVVILTGLIDEIENANLLLPIYKDFAAGQIMCEIEALTKRDKIISDPDITSLKKDIQFLNEEYNRFRFYLIRTHLIISAVNAHYTWERIMLFEDKFQARVNDVGKKFGDKSSQYNNLKLKLYGTDDQYINYPDSLSQLETPIFDNTVKLTERLIYITPPDFQKSESALRNEIEKVQEIIVFEDNLIKFIEEMMITLHEVDPK